VSRPTIADRNGAALGKVADAIGQLAFTLLYERELRMFLRWPFGKPPFPPLDLSDRDP
jgi:hypothetical protein